MFSIVQKLKSKHTSLKNYTNWAKLSHVTQDLEFMYLLTHKLWAMVVRLSHIRPKTGKMVCCKIGIMIYFDREKFEDVYFKLIFVLKNMTYIFFA